jgi:hypothetical protein
MCGTLKHPAMMSCKALPIPHRAPGSYFMRRCLCPEIVLFGEFSIQRRNSKAFATALLLIGVLIFLRFGNCGKSRDIAFATADMALCKWLNGDAAGASEEARNALRLSPDTGWLAFVYRVTLSPETAPGPFHEADEMLAHFRLHRGFTASEAAKEALPILIRDHAQSEVSESRAMGWERVADRLATCPAVTP